jgi:SNF2 family DNA or RNA helicase
MTTTLRTTLALHACWTGGMLRLWGEDPRPLDAARSDSGRPRTLAEGSLVARALHAFVGDSPQIEPLFLRLPTIGGPEGEPVPSAKVLHLAGMSSEEWTSESAVLADHRVECVTIPAARAPGLLDALIDAQEDGESDLTFACDASIEFFALAGRFSRHLLTQQRFVPSLHQSISGDLRGVWQPWVSDEANAAKVATLVAAMPPSARAAVDALQHEPWPILEDYLTRVTDALARRVLIAENLADAIDGRDPVLDLQVAWLGGMLADQNLVVANNVARQELVKRVRGWVSLLEERGASSAWRLMLRLNEPADTVKPEDDPTWSVSFHLQSVEKPSLVIDAADIWLLPGDSATVEGRRIDGPQELLLGELGRASRLFPKLESALGDSEPIELVLTTKQAYEFLREVRPALIEQGFGASVPEWWDSPMARLGARLRLESDELPPIATPGSSASPAGSPQLGLGSLVRYRWEIAIGDASLSLHEFEQLASKRQPLVKVNGRWVEIRPEDVQAAIKFIRENPGGEMPLGDALRIAYGVDSRKTGIPVVGLEGSGWVAAMLNAEAAQRSLAVLEPPKAFRGTLRPYQIRGMSWMAFMESLGFGLCLADDMGLGKTIQLLALLAMERELNHAGAPTPASPAAPAELHSSGDSSESIDDTSVAGVEAKRSAAPATSNVPVSDANPTGVGPTLLVVPTSVVGNWIHESARFCPNLRVLVHHGATRLQGDALLHAARNSDVVITTYALVNRDRDQLGTVRWRRVVLDEAQYIKNPAAKQAQAVRSLESDRRIALTGTPVENRLSELWSIVDFLNPGYLGTAGMFRQRFGVAIERYRDKSRAEQLRGLVRPFILRRLKTDPTVVADLPDKLESREYCHLTTEQASLYESCVRRMLAEVDKAEGIHRRGLVLSALIRLKQICNHPSQMLKDHEQTGIANVDPSRSGKCVRLLEMLDEILAEGDCSLIFTQFRQMGHLLEAMLVRQFERRVLFLHGGTPTKQRQQIIDQFQKNDGTTPILLLSLKAGGVGLNLTAATHVFHFDRWWNPAVENQATDRAYRIGQTRTVQVHKFVVRGTLEERIDQMIEQKIELAQNIIGDGERWLTELDTQQLRELLTLREDAVGDEI